MKRDVAVKVLPSSNNPELKERFQREALALATLSHPHICQIFDVGSQDGIDFLVMEYLQGETLAQRLERGALPLQEALRYAIEISDALDEAHRKGFTHRDIKGNNLMLTKAGSKVLDFGLAKLRSLGATPAGNQTNLPTGTLTGDGRILGTLQYMAPEQLEGKEADPRTDIVAFGAVVYEMVTGRKAFEGKSQASLIGAILKDDPPPISSLKPMTPPALDRVVKTCLSKDPDDRWQSARDLLRELKWITEEKSAAATAAAVTAAPPPQPAPTPNLIAWRGALSQFSQ